MMSIRNNTFRGINPFIPIARNVFDDAWEAVLDPDYVGAGSDGPTYTQPVYTTASSTLGSALIEPPPGGYPRIIVHPERPNSPFAFIENGWYRSPTGDVVSYKTVAEYVLTAHGVDRAVLLKALGQVPAGSTFPFGVVALIAVALGLLLSRR